MLLRKEECSGCNFKTATFSSRWKHGGTFLPSALSEPGRAPSSEPQKRVETTSDWAPPALLTLICPHWTLQPFTNYRLSCPSHVLAWSLVSASVHLPVKFWGQKFVLRSRFCGEFKSWWFLICSVRFLTNINLILNFLTPSLISVFPFSLHTGFTFLFCREALLKQCETWLFLVPYYIA